MPCSPRMTACKPTCLHRQLVSDYRSERMRQEDVAETISRSCATERAEYLESNPLITFHNWLRWLKASVST